MFNLPALPTTFYYSVFLITIVAFPVFYTFIHRKFLAPYNYFIINPSILIASVPFILWDIYATNKGLWQFNKLYVSPFKLAGLPVEEYLFFIFVPQASLLIWIAFKRYSNFNQFKNDIGHHFRKKK